MAGFSIQTVKGLSKDRASELVGFLTTKFKQSVDARSQQVDGMYRRWIDNYDAKPLESIRTTPFYKASNFVPRLIGMHTDILAARIIGMMFGTRPFWKPEPYDPDFNADASMTAARWMDRLSHSEMEIFDPLDMGIFLTCKTGVSVLKNTWLDDTWGTFKPDANGGITRVGRPKLAVDILPYDDFFPYPVTAINLSQCTIKFHRLRFTKEEIQYRMHSTWKREAAEKLINSGTPQQGTGREAQANNAGISLTVDVTRPYNAIEAWLQYELSPGQMHDIVVLFNPYCVGEDALLRDPYYNYFAYDLDPFIDLRIAPRENLFWGYSVPEILEQAQEEKAQIHNSRRDGNLIANVPAWKKKRLADVANPSTEWYPGKVFEVDNMDDLMPLEFAREYNSLLEEEAALDGYAERLTGGGPAQQGFGTGPLGKKGIYASQATLALLTEGNKRLDIDLKRIRRPMAKQGKLIFTCYRDFAGNLDLGMGSSNQLLKQAFEMSRSADGRGFFYELGVSDAGANQEVDRQNILLMSNTMQGYYKEIMAIAPQIAGMPDGSPAKTLALAVLDGARDLANRILFLFNIPGKRALIPNVRELLGGGAPAPRSTVADQVGLPQAEGPLPDEGISAQAANISAVAQGLRAQSPGQGLPV